MINEHTNSVLEVPSSPTQAVELRERVADDARTQPNLKRWPVSNSGLRREWKVIACVAVVLLSVECGIRGLESRLSKDLIGIRLFPKIAATLSDPKHASDHRILFLGNSLTRDGVNVDAVTEELTSSTQSDGKASVFVRKAAADGTGIVEWFYAFRNQFLEAGHAPDIVVLGFEGPGGGHISDARKFDPSALGYLFSGLDDIPEVMQHDLTNFGQRGDYLLGLFSAAYANRGRVQQRVLDSIIPGYRETSERINLGIDDHQPKPSTDAPEASFSRLERFVDLAEAHGVRVVLVAIPVPDAYEIEPGLIDFAAMRNVPLIDARHVDGIDDSMFPDGLHMNATAAKRFSRFVANQLACQTARPTSLN